MSEKDEEIERARRIARDSPFLNTEQAAAFLKIGARQLKHMRSNCTGPRYRLHGRLVRYHVDDLVIWSRANSPDRHSEAGAGSEGEKADA